MATQDRKIGLLAISSLGFTIVIAVALGFAAGFWLDRWLGSAPYLTIGGLALGIAAGFWAVVKEVVRKDHADR